MKAPKALNSYILIKLIAMMTAKSAEHHALLGPSNPCPIEQCYLWTSKGYVPITGVYFEPTIGIMLKTPLEDEK